MTKYIIKNCPAFMRPSYCKDKCSYSIANKRDGELTYKFEFDENSKCQDCTDCVMKQIVELCKEDLKPAREWQEGDTVFIEYKKDVHLANNILQLLDIQEVE